MSNVFEKDDVPSEDKLEKKLEALDAAACHDKWSLVNPDEDADGDEDGGQSYAAVRMQCPSVDH